MTARSPHAGDARHVLMPPMRSEVMEAAAVVDQIGRTFLEWKFEYRGLDDFDALPAGGDPLAGPGDGGFGEIHGPNAKSLAGQVHGVAAVAAAQIYG
ncbi:Uncharacterised protein [Chromobacterium vaccinii]|nr:Uncharacterised protein [Chromobacterium vaccinii]